MADQIDRTISPCERYALEDLARDLYNAAGVDKGDIASYLYSDKERDQHFGHVDFLDSLGRDVWWHYDDDVGTHRHRPDYEKTEKRIRGAVLALQDCQEGTSRQRCTDPADDLKRRYRAVFED